MPDPSSGQTELVIDREAVRALLADIPACYARHRWEDRSKFLVMRCDACRSIVSVQKNALIRVTSD